MKHFDWLETSFTLILKYTFTWHWHLVINSTKMLTTVSRENPPEYLQLKSHCDMQPKIQLGMLPVRSRIKLCCFVVWLKVSVKDIHDVKALKTTQIFLLTCSHSVNALCLLVFIVLEMPAYATELLKSSSKSVNRQFKLGSYPLVISIKAKRFCGKEVKWSGMK